MKKQIIYIFIFAILIISIVLVSSGRFDLNNDGNVNIQDLQLLASHYQGKSAYNSTFDLNGDGKIDLFDVVKIARDINTSSGSAGSSSNVTPYFSDGFENYTNGSSIVGAGSNGFTWGSWDGSSTTPSDGRAKVSEDVAHSGNKSLKLTYVGVVPGKDDYSEEYFHLAPNSSTAPKEIWMEWYVYFPSNYHFRSNESPNNNKLFNIWAENYSHSPLVDLEYEGNSSRITPLINYYTIWNGSSTNKGGTNAILATERPLWTNDASIVGTWHQIRLHFRCGDGGIVNGGSDNGVADIWFDGILVASVNVSTYPLYDSTNNYFRTGYLMGWANAGFTENTSFYIDDFKVWSQNPGW